MPAQLTESVLLPMLLVCFATLLMFSSSCFGASIPYDNCNKTVGCFGLPDPSCVNWYNCTDVVMYNRSNIWTPYSAAVHFEIYSPRGGNVHDENDKYVSVGVKNRGRMPLSAIFSCLRDAFGNYVNTQTSYAVAHVRPLKTHIGEIANRKVYIDGDILRCSFDITSAVFNVGISKYNVANPIHILMAGGDASDGELTHHKLRAASAQKILLTQYP